MASNPGRQLRVYLLKGAPFWDSAGGADGEGIEFSSPSSAGGLAAEAVVGWLQAHCTPAYLDRVKLAATGGRSPAAAAASMSPTELRSACENCAPFVMKQLMVRVACGADYTLAISEAGDVFSWCASMSSFSLWTNRGSQPGRGNSFQ